ncbi:MAG: hypothetical protein NUW23_15005 [Firmicutes bacterium]|jgi:hypothetical protein|nr:hypothetical protein [Bacillota bacterium]
MGRLNVDRNLKRGNYPNPWVSFAVEITKDLKCRRVEDSHPDEIGG